MLTAGIDIGSVFSKIVLLNDDIVAGQAVVRTGGDVREASQLLLEQVLKELGTGPESIEYTVATGYGRAAIPFAHNRVTEITCFARGVRNLFPGVRTVIDIGGQDSKGIKLSPEGRVLNFVMNDKCAAGTGRFLEVMAGALGVPLEEFGELSLRSDAPAEISGKCTVFAESQVISLVAQGASRMDIIAGLHQSIAQRIQSMVSPLRIEREVSITGGGAKNIGLVKALQREIGCEVLVPPEPQLVGALGAALLAREFAFNR